MLQLPIVFDLRGMRLPVSTLVIGMRLTPLAAAIAHDLRIFGIGFEALAMIVGAPLPLALGLAADALIGTKLGRLKGLLAVTAATGRRQAMLL